MATRVEVKQDDGPIQLRLDLVLNPIGADRYSTEIAPCAAPSATPHANRGSPSEGSHVHSSRPWLPRRRRIVRRPRPVHPFRLIPLVRKRYVTCATMRRGRSRGKRWPQVPACVMKARFEFSRISLASAQTSDMFLIADLDRNKEAVFSGLAVARRSSERTGWSLSVVVMVRGSFPCRWCSGGSPVFYGFLSQFITLISGVL